MRNIVANELKNRVFNENYKKSKYEIVGVEIKTRRIRLGITLDALSQSICSVSYLCKIERNKIEPNVAFLREICSRLDLTENKAEILLNLKDVLNNCVKAYLRRDFAAIKKAVQDGEGFDNYRYTLINYVYCLAIKDYYTANRIYSELQPIISSMLDSDFLVFSVFSAILQFHNFHFKEAIEIVNGLEKFNLFDELRSIANLYGFYSSAALSSSSTPYMYSKVKDSLIDNGLFNLLDEARYVLALYYLKTNSLISFDKIINGFSNLKYKNSIMLIKAFQLNNVSEIIKYKKLELTDYAKLLLLYVINKDKFDENVKNLDRDYYDYMLDTVYVDYLANKDKADFHTYLFRELIPRAGLVQDEEMKLFILKEVAKFPNSPNKNRTLMRAMILLYNDETFED